MGKSMQTIGDKISCGGRILTGSPNVFLDGKPVARKGDMGSGHGCFPPTRIITASSTVFVNGIPAARRGDQLKKHGCGVCPKHIRKCQGEHSGSAG